jgi:hypothetical protein
MRACFLGQNVTALGFGVAMLQTPPLPEPERDLKADDAPQNAPEPPKLLKVTAPEAA